MKKLLMVITGVLLLVGCSDDKTVTPKEIENNQDSVIESTEPEVDTEIEDSRDTSENVGSTELSQNLEEYEEYQILSEKIDLAVYQAEIGTDNPGKRIILFSNADGKKIYKSVYIKHDRYLKIIKLDNEGLLYNGQVN